MSIIPQSWLFVAVAIPLTIGTFAIWKVWLAYTVRGQESNKCRKENSFSGYASRRFHTLWNWRRNRNQKTTNSHESVFRPDVESVAITSTIDRSSTFCKYARGEGV